ncbi:MAG: DNA gyrase inhibitor YacG [Flavobacteriales bacterium]|nr:DNA gyrase inhibitor YacG [Flavobacteriales bacterium]|tara:strand:- start:1409 stop:1573 length:165 start_codon:yes stop_codon:yes gene_type:complete
MAKCPRCEKKVDLAAKNDYRPFCSEKCKLIDFGSWANEDNKISRPIKSEDFYED